MITLQDTSKAGNTRFIIWESLIPLFKEMPWYGLGMGSLWVFWPPYRPANDGSAGYFAHNDYMQITLEAGYPGIIILLALFIFILISFIKTLKNSKSLNLLQRVEFVSLFAALTTFAAHSFFTYNFYILPLLLIAGLYLGRFNHLSTINPAAIKTVPAIKNYFKPVMYIISSTGIIIILTGYFVTTSLSSYYNIQAKALMAQHEYKDSNTYFVKAQKLAPLMDNPFFSHADLLRRAADKLITVNKNQQAIALLSLAHNKLNTAKKLNPLRPQVHHIRGLIYERAQHEKAIVEYKKALVLNPRFLFSRIRLATLLHQKNELKKAVQVLYDGVNYTYPVNKVMIEYMTLFAKLTREAGVISFAQNLENNIKKYKNTYNLAR
jgi:tetratricopeptide (TPR) repeat protein